VCVCVCAGHTERLLLQKIEKIEKIETVLFDLLSLGTYGVATMSTRLKIIGLFCRT